MGYIPFWIFFAVSLLLALAAIRIRKLKFIDIEIMIMTIALSMSLDMIFCKHLELYNYVDINYKGWYSFWANFFIIPSFGLIFIKFIPSGIRKIGMYIIIWSIGCTLLELYILKPTGIVEYAGWNPFPYSTIGYILVLIWEYIYFRVLEKRINQI